MKPYLISQSQAVLSLLRPPVLGGHTVIIALIVLFFLTQGCLQSLELKGLIEIIRSHKYSTGIG